MPPHPATWPYNALYGHVREFSPSREEEVIVMQQVTEIYGRENGWVHSSVKYIRRASATSSASLNVLPDWTLILCLTFGTSAGFMLWCSAGVFCYGLISRRCWFRPKESPLAEDDP